MGHKIATYDLHAAGAKEGVEVCDRVTRIPGANAVEAVHNHHNFAWRENHNGRDLWVVLEGATPAFPGQKGFVGGAMGEQSVILEGVESELGRQSSLLVWKMRAEASDSVTVSR